MRRRMRRRTRVTTSSIFASDISDHLPIIAHFDYEASFPVKSSALNLRIITNDRIITFQKDLSSTASASIIEACVNSNPNDAYEDL